MKWLPKKEICLSLAEKSGEALVRQGAVWQEKVDILEIRLDALAGERSLAFMAEISLPLLCTNRPAWEGGGWQGDEEGRVALLAQAAENGAACLDLELRAPEESWRQLRAALADHEKCALLTSWHDFHQTPADDTLREVFWQMAASGADIGKIVTTAHDFTDVLRVLHLQLLAREEGFPLAAFCMGEAGRISRAATLSLGGVLTYVAGAAAAATAPGQLTIAEIHEIRRCLHDH